MLKCYFSSVKIASGRSPCHTFQADVSVRETWQEWTKRNQELIRNTTFGVDPETGELREVNGATIDYSIKYLFVTDNEEGPFINGNDSLSIWDPSGRVTMFIWLTEKRGETITANMEILPKEYIFDM